MCDVNNLIIPIITHDIAPREPSARRGSRSNPSGRGVTDWTYDFICIVSSAFDHYTNQYSSGYDQNAAEKTSLYRTTSAEFSSTFINTITS
ncbi:hypothetical protein E3N88_25909 [Mikania micrantha]|uniref:Uncharacterized protein n=1 Tax=Mikania micrantha TaxID=192012 RepID=A0A5N6N7N4_9ASTR|nr:hypothetical protein E3N88_25909 [Mikania micrantha]